MQRIHNSLPVLSTKQEMVYPTSRFAYVVSSLDELVAELHKAFEGDVVDVDHVMLLMKSYKSNPAEWKKYAKFDRYR